MPIQQVILVLSPFDNSFFLKISGKFTISGYHLSSCVLLFVHVFQRLESYRWFDLGSIQCTFFVHLEGQRLLSFDCIDAQLGDSSCLCWTSLIHFALGSGWKKFLAFIATRCCLLVPFMCRLYFSVPFVRRCLT